MEFLRLLRRSVYCLKRVRQPTPLAENEIAAALQQQRQQEIIGEAREREREIERKSG